MSAPALIDHAKRAQLLRLARTGLRVALAAAAWSASAPTAWAAKESSLPVVDALPEALARALSRREPLLVMVSLHGCAFCKVVRESYLLPLQAEGLPVVQINMREDKSLVDFQGNKTTHDQWVRQQNVRIAPTVLFFGREGQEVAARLKGAYLPDFYNAYLEEQLALARRAVQKSLHA